LKDAHSTAGMRTTVGFPPLADHMPQEDSSVTARLKAAGGVLIGKTNVPTMLADYQSNNPIFGRSNNPWNVARTPGGSSGGAAAALAAGLTPFEIGTDLSGSIRIPAHYCGVFGLKPTEQRVPLTGLIPDPRGTPRSIRIMSCIGPMARTVEDLALLYPMCSRCQLSMYRNSNSRSCGSPSPQPFRAFQSRRRFATLSNRWHSSLVALVRLLKKRLCPGWISSKSSSGLVS
jgi:Asp-tRNA(Asn)/Glu-tRNA(Gln) amidotransferase A subunit family amidase